MRKIANAFSLGKSTVSKVIREVCKSTSINLKCLIKLPNTINEVNEMVLNFYLAHGFPQCLGDVDGSHVNIKRPKTNANDYMNRKGHYSFNVPAAADYQYCFFDVVIKWPGSVHDGRIFSNSWLNESLRNEYVPSRSKIIVEGGGPVPVCILGDPAYPLLSFLMKEFVNRGANEKEQFFGFKLSFARMVIECAFGRLKGRFGCLRREMDINIEDLPYVIHACFLLHNFCELHKEPAHQNLVEAAKKYDSEFQPTNKSSGYQTSNNESTGKKFRIFLKYFEHIYDLFANKKSV